MIAVNLLFKYILVGVLLGAGFIVPGLWWTVFLGISYYLWLLQHNHIGLWSSWLIWSIKYSLAIWWFWSVYPIDWIQVTPHLTLAAIAFCWIVSSLSLGSGGALMWFLYQTLFKRTKFVWLFVPLTWLVCELFGSLIFSIVSYGPGATIGTKFSFGYVGYHLAHHELLIHLSHLAGVYGLTVVIVGLAITVLWLYKQRPMWAPVFTIGLVLTGLLSLPANPLPEHSNQVSVAIVDTKIPKDYWHSEEKRLEKQKQLEEAFEAARSLSVDYIIFPEDSRLFDQSNLLLLQDQLSFFTSPTDPIIVDSGRTVTTYGDVLQGMLFNPADKKIVTVHKRYLVPEGEFLSSLYILMLRAINLHSVVDSLKQIISYTAGEQTSQSMVETPLPGLLFCFESADPKGVYTIMRERNSEVPFVAHVVSHAWFNQPTTLWPQLESMLRVQAIWNDVPIVVAANHAQGYVVNAQGEVTYPHEVARGRFWMIREGSVVIR